MIGVIVGAVASYAVTALAERTRWKRQTAERWDERRLVAYADYSQAVKTIVTLAHRLAAFRGLNPDAKPLSPTEDNLALLQEAEEQRSSCLESIRLLTDSDTLTAIRALNHCVWHLMFLAGDESASPHDWESAFTQYRQARDEYYRHARRSLGVPGVAVSRD
ncbi:hypothetical protein OH805_38400 [Streptomyces sp. NBC_00879]|uniref:hypothetical protein n=1 Tax=Streptomyces sp. NBC_00879 TaxID=2975855 RepID=UPI00386B6963|nr:hypothetical protein OH805_38400 [Streptomyces sp. NBC_00879]